jgi:DNA-binding transcriptional LysR family regulator
MRRSLRDIALRVHVDVPQDLIKHVAGGLVDVAIMYAPQHLPGLKIDLLMEEELVLVTTNPEAPPLEALLEDTDYVHVDWGPDFVLRHGMSFREAIPSLFVNLGPLGLSYILSAGGSGYFRVRAVQPHIASGRLRLVPGAPQFSFPIYVVHSADGDDAVLGPALAGLRTVISPRSNNSPVGNTPKGNRRKHARIR